MPQELSDDWTPVTDLDEARWERVRNDSMRELDRIAERAMELEESRLSEIVPGREFNFYFLLHGVAQHTIYHAGQIAVLKRQISASA